MSWATTIFLVLTPVAVLLTLYLLHDDAAWDAEGKPNWRNLLTFGVPVVIYVVALAWYNWEAVSKLL